MLEIKELCSGYNKIDIIKDINIKVNKGENLFIIGPNGCGKSTFLKSIANIIDYNGRIEIDGEDISSLKRKDLAKKVGLMSQVSEIYF
jgi:iron complex transport system ATP-binding protein